MDKQRYRVFVSGDWRSGPAEKFKNEAFKLGVLLAKDGFDLTCGPGSGISRYVLDGYCSLTKELRGKIIFYLPKMKDMLRVGESMDYPADIVVDTKQDYPMRNIIQVRDADTLIAITGGAGTVCEIITAAMDYNMPVAILDGSGPMTKSIKALPNVREKVFFAKTALSLIKYIKSRLDTIDRTRKLTTSPNSTLISV